MSKHRPPRLPLRILRFFCAQHRIEELEGDLYEEFLENLEDLGPARARRRYAWTIIRSFRRYIFEYPPHRHKLSYMRMMLSHYLKTALRGMKTNKALTVINLLGLSVGIATSLMISLFIADQYLMDDFIPDKAHIVRLEGQAKNSAFTGFNPLLHPGLGPAILEMAPQVETYTRLSKSQLDIRIEKEDGISFFDETFLFADSSFFQLFPFELTRGNPNTVFENRSSVLITERMAFKLFGTEDPLGKIIPVRYRDRASFTVTGVLKDIPPHASLQFDFLSLEDNNYPLTSGGYGPVAIYLKLGPETDREALTQLIEREVPKLTKHSYLSQLQYRFTPLEEVKYNTESSDSVIPAMNKSVIDLFAFLAVFILLLATINYINLTAAKALQRGQEAGIRKIIGAGRRSFAYQFLTESLLFCWLSVPIALLLVHACLPAFEKVLQKTLYNSYLTDPTFLLSVFGLLTLLALVAGIYPALIVSRFRFTDFLKGKISRSAKGTWFRKGLVIFQFTISIILVAGTLIVQRQLDYVQEQTMAFEGDQILVLDYTISSKLLALKNTLETIPAVSQVSITSSPPGGEHAHMYWFDEDFGERLYLHEIDEHYLSLLNLQLLSGQGFAEATKEAFTDEVLINQTMARLIESTNSLNSEFPLGESYELNGKRLKIRGVVEDFHIQSLHERIKPMMFRYSKDASRAGRVMIKINTEDITATMDKIEGHWNEFIPKRPFRAAFLDARFEKLYTAEVRLGKVFGLFTLIAISISCLGLFGLITYMTEARIKEIGIRKVLGAKTGQIMWSLNRQVQFLILMACLIALPVATFASDQWLNSFAYRTQISIAQMLTIVLGVVLIATLTIMAKTLQAAATNPADSLRNE